MTLPKTGRSVTQRVLNNGLVTLTFQGGAKGDDEIGRTQLKGELRPMKSKTSVGLWPVPFVPALWTHSAQGVRSTLLLCGPALDLALSPS